MRSKTLVVLAVFVIIVIASGAAIWGTSQPSFCNSCHEMKSDVTSWANSKHAKVNCEECHIRPGIVNTVVRKTQAIGEVTAHFTKSYRTPINKDSALSRYIPSDNCLECHKTPTKKNYGSYVFEHGEHSKTNCAFCHNRVVHASTGTYKNRLEMEACIDCHKAKNKPVTCKTCHPEGVTKKPASHLTGSWVSTHKASAKPDCTTGCHSQSFCSNCHSSSEKMPASHKTASWTRTHESSVNADCTKTCHTKSFCDSCHRGSKARPASHTAGNWVSVHKNSANASCTANCHSQTFCSNCHRSSNVMPASHKTGNWIENHEHSANSSCTAKCHNKTFCNNCHASHGEEHEGGDRD